VSPDGGASTTAFIWGFGFAARVAKPTKGAASLVHRVRAFFLRAPYTADWLGLTLVCVREILRPGEGLPTKRSRVLPEQGHSGPRTISMQSARLREHGRWSKDGSRSPSDYAQYARTGGKKKLCYLISTIFLVTYYPLFCNHLFF
jgi:hypothetical protein